MPDNAIEKKKLVGIVSPPYANRLDDHGSMRRSTDNWAVYGRTKGQIGAMQKLENTEEPFDITQFHSCTDSLYWHGCYSQDARFNQYVTPESFAHPAKGAWGLYDRIFKHIKHLELLQKGDVVCDFMAGSGRTGILSSLHGHDFVGIELEPHFIKMINDNKTRLENKIGRKVSWQVIQGDSRRLSELLDGQFVGVTSPPYSKANDRISKGKIQEGRIAENLKSGRTYEASMHGFSDGQIANLPDKNLVGITSPPFENIMGASRLGLKIRTQQSKIHQEKHIGFSYTQQQNENLGNQQGESYLSAMLQVYQEAAKVMPIIVTVTKNPTRNGKLRRLDLDTAKLLEMTGYKIMDYHRAVLFEERKQATLKGGIKKQVDGRLSFFKRLSVQKGNVAAQWEDVIIGIK